VTFEITKHEDPQVREYDRFVVRLPPLRVWTTTIQRKLVQVRAALQHAAKLGPCRRGIQCHAPKIETLQGPERRIHPIDMNTIENNMVETRSVIATEWNWVALCVGCKTWTDPDPGYSDTMEFEALQGVSSSNVVWVAQ
jgi:hypothetical protein